MDRGRGGERERESDDGEPGPNAVRAKLVAEHRGGREAEDECVRPRLPGVGRGSAGQRDERGDEAVPRARAPRDDGEEARAREQEAHERRDAERDLIVPEHGEGGARDDVVEGRDLLDAGLEGVPDVAHRGQLRDVPGVELVVPERRAHGQRAHGEHVRADDAGDDGQPPRGHRVALRRASLPRTRT